VLGDQVVLLSSVFHRCRSRVTTATPDNSRPETP
jgi:hypothetical protein